MGQSWITMGRYGVGEESGWCRNWREHEKVRWQVSRCGSMAGALLKFQNSILRQISLDIEEVTDSFSFDYSRPWDVGRVFTRRSATNSSGSTESDQRIPCFGLLPDTVYLYMLTANQRARDNVRWKVFSQAFYFFVKSFWFSPRIRNSYNFETQFLSSNN